MDAEPRSLSQILGPWQQPDFESALLDRCRIAWSKPIKDLTNQELATFLRQRVAVTHIMSTARKRSTENVDDGSEIYEGELAAAIEYADYCDNADHEDRRIREIEL